MHIKTPHFAHICITNSEFLILLRHANIKIKTFAEKYGLERTGLYAQHKRTKVKYLECFLSEVGEAEFQRLVKTIRQEHQRWLVMYRPKDDLQYFTYPELLVSEREAHEQADRLRYNLHGLREESAHKESFFVGIMPVTVFEP